MYVIYAVEASRYSIQYGGANKYDYRKTDWRTAEPKRCTYLGNTDGAIPVFVK